MEPKQGPWTLYQQKGQEVGPWLQYKSSEEPKKKERFSTKEASALGATSGASFGLLDEGAAMVKTGKDLITGQIKPSSLSELLKSYKENQQKYEADLDEARKEHPYAYGASELAGGVATSFIPGLGVLNAGKAATLSGSLLRAGAAGGVAGLGYSRADLTSGDANEYAEAAGDVGQGILTSMAFQRILSPLQKATKTGKQTLKELSEERAMKTATGQNISHRRRIARTTKAKPGSLQKTDERLSKTSRDLLDEPDALGYFDTTQDLAYKLPPIRDKYGRLIGEVGEQIDKGVPDAVSTKNMASQMRKYASELPKNRNAQKLANEVLLEADAFEAMGPISFKKAQELKNQFKFNAVDKDILVSNKDVANKLNRIISQEMDDTVERLSQKNPFELTQLSRTGKVVRGKEKLIEVPPAFRQEFEGLADKYKFYKGKYGSFEDLSNAAADRAEMNRSNRFASPSDYGFGLAATIVKGATGGGLDPMAAVYGVASTLGHKFVRERGSAFVAKSADTIVKALEKQPAQVVYKALTPIIKLVSEGNINAALTMQAVREKNPELYNLYKQQDAMERRSKGSK